MNATPLSFATIFLPAIAGAAVILLGPRRMMGLMLILAIAGAVAFTLIKA
jgi:hypothetical protein